MSKPTSRSVISGAAAATIGLGALIAAGCGSDDDKSSETTAASGAGSSTTAATSTTSAASSTSQATATTAGSGSSGTLPAPPAGAQELQSTNSNGITYARYQVSNTTAAQVVADYQSELQSSGYTVTDTGGGGGGWGKWGGAGAGLTAQDAGSYVAVQAGGESSGPVYFEVCQGADSSAVQECENQSEGPDDQDDDSNSGAS